MANKKLKNFEFANHTERGSSRQINTDELTYFHCVNGSVFLLCQDNNDHELEVSPASLATERLKYYLENEYVDNPANALSNALIYTNGFIYEYGRKNDDYKGVYVQCACLLIRDNQVYYSAVGELSLYYFNGRKPFLISKGDDMVAEDKPDDTAESEPADIVAMLGRTRNITPLVNREPLVPVDEDMLLMCSKGFYEKVSEKSILKILEDPMPVQTKVYRFVDMASIAGGQDNISIQLISFYNLEHKERKFFPLDIKKSRVTKKKTRSFDKDEHEDGQEKTTETHGFIEKIQSSPIKYVLIVLAVLFLSYMFYDLFIHNPMPPVKIPATEQQGEPVEREAEGNEDDEPGTAKTPIIPGDTLYTVKNGDTWSRIYSQFGVCSWFIKSHASNAGKFDSDENPVAGRQIHIPLLYSAKPELNPDFYNEFSLQNTGSRCENANQAFIDKFQAENFQ